MYEFSKRISDGVAKYKQRRIDIHEAHDRQLAEATERARQIAAEIAQVLRENNCPTDQLWRQTVYEIHRAGEGWTLQEPSDGGKNWGEHALGVTSEGEPFQYTYIYKDMKDELKRIATQRLVLIQDLYDPIQAVLDLQSNEIEQDVVRRIVNSTREWR